jgi:hypothetical protein
MDFEMKSSGEFVKQLRDLSERAKLLDGTHNIPIPELLPPSFLAGCSKFASADEMFQASGFKVESANDFQAIPDGEWDAFIKSHTSFESWRTLLEAAGAAWSKKQLGLS